jgi:hypothetical protein
MLSKRQKDVVSLFYEMHAAEGSGGRVRRKESGVELGTVENL